MIKKYTEIELPAEKHYDLERERLRNTIGGTGKTETGADQTEKVEEQGSQEAVSADTMEKIKDLHLRIQFFNAITAKDHEKVDKMLKKHPYLLNATMTEAEINLAGEMEKIDKNFEIKGPLSFGETPLHYVQDPKMAEKFIALGADVKAKDVNGLSPLHHAIIYNNLEMAKLLHKHDPDGLTRPDAKGNTPVMDAIALGHLDLLRSFVVSRSDFNAQNEDGDTGLHGLMRANDPHIASVDDMKKMFTHIQQLGGHINIRNDEGKTPLDILDENIKNETNSSRKKELMALRKEMVEKGCVSGKKINHVAVNSTLRDSGVDISAGEKEGGNTPQGRTDIGRV